VLKFQNSRINASDRLNKEKKWWDDLYPQFESMTAVEVWGGSPALMMPHICAIPEENRSEFIDKICELLVKTFHMRGYRHLDVAWRNIGFCVDKYDEEIPFLFDLERVENISLAECTLDWVKIAMTGLFPALELAFIESEDGLHIVAQASV
jgi:hypothetical protein